MKHKIIEGRNTSLRNGYTAKYFSDIFRMVFLYLSMKTKRIMLFTMIMLFLPLSLLSDDNSTFLEDENLYFYKYIDTDNGNVLYFSFEISKNSISFSCNEMDVSTTTFMDGSITTYMDVSTTTYTRNGNLYNLIDHNGYSSTIELVKKRVEFIEYFSVNVEIYKDKKLLHKFSSDSEEYYDYRYPNCIATPEGSGLYPGLIQIHYDKQMNSAIIDILNENKWSIYNNNLGPPDKYIDIVDCYSGVWVHVKEGKEFNAISKINGLNNGVCATRVVSNEMRGIEEYLFFDKDIDTGSGKVLYFSFNISKKDKNIFDSSFDEMDDNITTNTRKGNLYNLKYLNGYSSTIELVKKRIEFIEYYSINVEIHKNNELRYKFSSDSIEYYDYRYPNCISTPGDDLNFYPGLIQIHYDKPMNSAIIDILNENKWLIYDYNSDPSDKYIDIVDCQSGVWVHVKEGEEFHVISKINGLNNGVCATRVATEAGGEIAPVELPPTDIGEKSSVDNEIEKMQTANIVFDTPSSMYRNKTYIINLKLDAVKDISDLLKELSATEKESAVVKYSSTMKAELISENKKAFEITLITPDTQVISSINTTSWKWDVTPLEQGEQNLHLSLTAFLDIEGKEKALSIKTFDKVIVVNIAYPDEIFLFMQNNWKWILGSLLFPLVGFWWKNNRKKEEE